MNPRIWPLVIVIVAVVALHAGLPTNAQAPAPAKPEATPGATPSATLKPAVVKAKRFASAEEATEALVAALRAGDSKAMVGVLGSEGRALVQSGDSAADRQSREKFLQAYDAGHRLVPS